MRKILYSPGFGAGWTTWNSSKPEVAKYMLEYKPIIDFLEKGNKFTNEDCCDYDNDGKIHPLLKQLQKECEEKFDESYICVLGADQLRVAEVSGLVRIKDYDGSESIEEQGECEGWM